MTHPHHKQEERTEGPWLQNKYVLNPANPVPGHGTGTLADTATSLGAQDVREALDSALITWANANVGSKKGVEWRITLAGLGELRALLTKAVVAALAQSNTQSSSGPIYPCADCGRTLREGSKIMAACGRHLDDFPCDDHPVCYPEKPQAMVEQIVREVAELPDRTSPDDAPDMMLVSADELTAIVSAALAQSDAQPDTERRLRLQMLDISEHAGAHLCRAEKAEAERDALQSDAQTLQECEPGLFLFDASWGFKTEYLTPEGIVEAYCVETGEFFWGGASDNTARSKLLVKPIDYASAFRRYAGDRRVTDAMVEAFGKDMYGSDWPDYETAIRQGLEAAARAKPSEKGGADV